MSQIAKPHGVELGRVRSLCSSSRRRFRLNLSIFFFFFFRDHEPAFEGRRWQQQRDDDEARHMHDGTVAVVAAAQNINERVEDVGMSDGPSSFGGLEKAADIAPSPHILPLIGEWIGLPRGVVGLPV